jgi:hypothetical protein
VFVIQSKSTVSNRLTIEFKSSKNNLKDIAFFQKFLSKGILRGSYIGFYYNIKNINLNEMKNFANELDTLSLVANLIAGVYILANFPPWRGGGGKRHFLEFGEENRPREKKKFLRSKKISNYIRKLFLNYNFNFKK